MTFFIKNLNNMEFHSLKILNYNFPTSNSVEINLEVTKVLKEKFIFNSGQFITISYSIDKTNYLRDYSICSTLEDENLTIVIKRTKNGTVSNHIFEHISEIKHLNISNPKGNFQIKHKPNEKRTLLFFATGSGITPIYSMIKSTLKKEKRSSIYLFYGNKTQEETIFFTELNKFKKEFPNQLNLFLIFSKQETDKLFQGRIDANKLKLFINQLLDWDEVDEIFICGKESMIREIAQTSFELGIPKKNIHFELYSPISEPIFKNEETSQNNLEKVEVEFIIDGETHQIQWKNKEKSLLDALLDENFDVPYSCKGGVCGSCTCLLKEGEIQIDENLVLTESEIKEGLILTCVANAKSNKIKISFDEN